MSRSERLSLAAAAVRENDADRLRTLLASHPDLVKERYSDGEECNFSLLYLATEWHRNDCAVVLLDAGADPDQPSGAEENLAPLAKALSRGNTALAERMASRREIPGTLRVAAGLGRIDPLRSFFSEEGSFRIDRQADAPRYAPGSNEPALLITDAFRYACRNGRTDAAVFLLDRALEIDLDAARAIESWSSREALVRFLVERRHIVHIWDENTLWEWARQILDEAEPLNLFDAGTPDHEGKTARTLAAEAGHAEVVKRLDAFTAALAGAVHPTRWTKPFNTEREEEFLQACQSAQLQRIREFLADDPQLVRAENKWGQNGIALNGSYGGYGRAPQAAELLLESGGDGVPALIWAAWWGGKEVIASVLARTPGGVPERELNEGLITCAIASRYNEGAPEDWLEPIRLFLDAGADVNHATRWGGTVYGLANDSLRPFLTERGARPEEVIPGLDDFFGAVRAGDVDRVCERVERDPRLIESYWSETHQSTLLMALELGHQKLLETWIDLKKQLDLNEAAALGESRIVRRLLDERWKLTRQVRGHGEPERPLHFTAWYGRLETAELLIERGYSPGASNNAFIDGSFVGPAATHRRTPLHLSAARGHLELVELFLSEMRAMCGPR